MTYYQDDWVTITKAKPTDAWAIALATRQQITTEQAT